MKKTTLQVNGSFPTTIVLGCQSIEHEATETSGWVICAHKFVFSSVPESGLAADEPQSIQNVMRRREKDPAKKAALARARARLGTGLEKAEGLTLTSLRLSKGFSQAKLGELIGQNQPYVARLEKERQDLRSKTISKLAAALEVSADMIIQLTQPEDEHEQAS